jgi:hypothetical protein
MKRFIGRLALVVFCSSAAFAQAPDSLNASDRPFLDTEPVDTLLLQSQLNLALGSALRDLDVELAYDERIARAADAMLRHPEFKDSTDENGYLIPFDQILVKNEGCPCDFVMKVNVSSKTNCGSVRNFDESDTYAAIASRYVAQMMDDNAELIQRSGFTGYGVGMMLTEEYPQLIDGRVLTDEPKDTWIHVLFFITL